MKLYLIRHGQTTHNVTGQHQGWAPVRLTEAGMDMAREARKKLADIHFDRIHCSDLLRTRQTAELIFPDEYKSGAITFEANLREIN
ncbi:MAG: histidine phosphatase family protein, partial [Ruminococcaceae bacterium]|nr:histidine phosphatase family protein [Oscillospiraceae bacterium]